MSDDEGADEAIDDLTVGDDHVLPDKLDTLFELQDALMHTIDERTHDRIPSWPADMEDENVQTFCKDIISRAQDELFEAKLELKKIKKHRSTSDASAFDRDKYLEEIVDVLKYVIEALIVAGFDATQLSSKFASKHVKVLQRINKEFGEADEQG